MQKLESLNWKFRLILARPNSYRDVSYLLAVAVAVVVIATLYLARVVLVPFALAMLFSFLLTPVVVLAGTHPIPPRARGIVRGCLIRRGHGLGRLDRGGSTGRCDQPTPKLQSEHPK